MNKKRTSASVSNGSKKISRVEKMRGLKRLREETKDKLNAKKVFEEEKEQMKKLIAEEKPLLEKLNKKREGTDECHICFERFCRFKVSPRLLSCGHTFCMKCIHQNALSENPTKFDPFNLTCPECKRKVSFVNINQSFLEAIKDIADCH